ncbi:MAG TPA: hypothetical protein VFQ72_00910 [Candidatus Paceibacterota bacterium]|nr:hypothetical protein [Candidatus Paceibacterota bacterium]
MAIPTVTCLAELAITGEKVGFEPKDYSAMANNRALMESVLKLVRGKAELVLKRFSLWLRAKVGGLSLDEIKRKLDNVSAGNGLVFRLGDWARDVMSKPAFVVAKEVEEADFVTVTPSDLGFIENPTTKELFDEENLAKHSLELCRPDDGPSLRLVYLNQPDGEWLPIAMKPIRDSDGSWDVLGLGRNGSKLWLDTGHGAHPESRWRVGRRFVFRLRKAQF